jgi:fermentation-respiration switch protein FrsA (DUF1100 family)
VLGPDEYDIPKGAEYEIYREEIVESVKKGRAMKHEDVSVQSFDGLTLRGRYYEYRAGAPLEILFHGYRGNSERDLSAGVERCFAIGRNALIVDHRASGESEGKVITFGILERKDCLGWVDFAIRHFGSDVKIILTGISMGAATVMMAAGEELPKNVVCVLADCGYSSPKEIIKKVMRDMKLPADLFYPFVKLGAKLFGGFDLEETSAMEAVKRAKVPVIFIHGESDDFVPCDMSRSLYEACCSHKKLLTIPGAGHGIAYLKDGEAYLGALRDFEKECGFLKS